jgi:hypothetical protein
MLSVGSPNARRRWRELAGLVNGQAAFDVAILDRVREYRRAARMAVQAEDHRFQDRCLALVDLAEAARAESDPTVRLWSERAVWEESREFLGMGDDLPEAPPEPFEAAQRRLRSRGLDHVRHVSPASLTNTTGNAGTNAVKTTFASFVAGKELSDVTA